MKAADGLDKLPWFPCEPTKLLGALAAMKAPKQLVYVVTLLRIYEENGPIRDTVRALANRTRLNVRVVSDAIKELFDEGRLIRAADSGITNPKAEQVMGEQTRKRKDAIAFGEKGGRVSAEKRKRSQRSEASHPTVRLEAVSSEIEGESEIEGRRTLFSDSEPAESPRQRDGVAPAPSTRKAGKAGTKLPEGWIPTRDDLFYGQQLGLSDWAVSEIAETMRLWCQSNANRPITTKSDWSATFKGFLRRDKHKYLGRRGPGGAPVGGRPNPTRGGGGGFAAVGQRLRERRTDDGDDVVYGEGPHGTPRH